MSWERVGKYAMRNGDWIVSKQYVDGCTLYAGWYQSEKPAKFYCNDFDEAKQRIREIENESNASR